MTALKGEGKMVMPLRVLVFASLVAVQAVCGLCLVFATTSYATETLTVTVLDNEGPPSQMQR